MCLQGAHTPEQASQLHLQPAALCCVPLAGVDHKHGVGGQAIIDGPQLAVCCGEDGPEAILTKVHAWPGHLQSVIVFWCQHRVWTPCTLSNPTSWVSQPAPPDVRLICTATMNACWKARRIWPPAAAGSCSCGNQSPCRPPRAGPHLQQAADETHNARQPLHIETSYTRDCLLPMLKRHSSKVPTQAATHLLCAVACCPGARAPSIANLPCALESCRLLTPSADCLGRHHSCWRCILRLLPLEGAP